MLGRLIIQKPLLGTSLCGSFGARQHLRRGTRDGALELSPKEQRGESRIRARHLLFRNIAAATSQARSYTAWAITVSDRGIHARFLGSQSQKS